MRNENHLKILLVDALCNNTERINTYTPRPSAPCVCYLFDNQIDKKNSYLIIYALNKSTAKSTRLHPSATNEKGLNIKENCIYSSIT